jgi:hypothetical protein
MCAYDGWACCIKIHASKQEVLDLIKELLFLNLAQREELLCD